MSSKNWVFYSGCLLAIMIEKFSYQLIIVNIWLKIFYSLYILVFTAVYIISIRFNFYRKDIKLLIAGNSLGAFFMSGVSLLGSMWVSFELWDSTFKIVLSLYFAALFGIEKIIIDWEKNERLQ